METLNESYTFVENSDCNNNSSDIMVETIIQPGSSAELPFREKAEQKLSQLPKRLVAVIDDGTNTIGFSVYTTPDFKVIASHHIETTIISPKDGWFEQDAMSIIKNIYCCIDVVVAKLPELGFTKDDIVTVGITNQRETTVAWDSVTGKPLYNAIAWNDIRTSSVIDKILERIPFKNKDYFKDICGLPISPYFSAAKMRWLKDSVSEVKQAYRRKRCCFGTIDSWLVWNLTKGAFHITDVTNASRTMLMNIDTLKWDPLLLKTFGISDSTLPEIRSSSEIYGKIADERCALLGKPISGILGNQQASLLGQMCIKAGQTKNTYRSGCFLLCNTGHKRIISRSGLLTTVAYKLGEDVEPVYALEGAVAVAGHALEWLTNKVRILPTPNEAQKFAENVSNTGDVYFVPAFTGLYAPYWRQDARGIIIGLTQFSNKYHVVRAALESICFQTRDILECMHNEAGFKSHKLFVDGQLSSNDLLMQLQADTAGVVVFRSQNMDTTAFGASMCAAQAAGIDLCKFDPHKRHYDNVSYDTFLPTSTREERQVRYRKWKKAVERSFDWIIKPNILSEERYRLLSSISAAIYIFTSFAMFIHSMKR